MASGFNIEQFKSQLNAQQGVLRNNRFLVTFSSPLCMINSQTSRKIEYWCEAINYPGYQLASSAVRRWVYGPSEQRPYGPTFQQIQCAFVADGLNEIREYFSTWMQKILPHDTGSSDGSKGMNIVSSYTSGFPYELAYKNTYVTELTIIVYGPNGVAVDGIVCKEAFPSNLTDMPLTWAEQNGVGVFSVNFDYLDWYKLTTQQLKDVSK